MFEKFKSLMTIVRNITNWYTLLLLYFGLKQNINVVFRNGIMVRIPNKSKLYLVFYINEILSVSRIIYNTGNRCTILFKDFRVTFLTNDEDSIYKAYIITRLIKWLNLKFHHWNFCEFDFEGRKVRYIFNPKDFTSIANLCSAFIDQEYGALNVKEKIVADIGASYGDTAIYFALKGASKVYAYEPIPWVAKIMLLNIQLNGLQEVVKIFPYAVSSNNNQKCLLRVPETATDAASLYYKYNTNTVNVYTKTITPPLDAHVVKMDCEGCEYDIILKWLKSKTYQEILVEYHSDYKQLVQKFKRIGYKVKILKKKRILIAY